MDMTNIYASDMDIVDSSFVITSENDKYGLADANGTILLECKYASIKRSNILGLFIVNLKYNDKAGLYDANMKTWILDCNYQSIWKFDPIYELACVNGDVTLPQTGFINKTGKFVIPPIYHMPYQDYFDCYGHMYLKDKSGKWGIVDYENKILLDFQYDSIERFYSTDKRFAKIKKDELWGYVDNNAQVILSPNYMEAFDFFQIECEWRTFVRKSDSLYYLIDETGRQIAGGWNYIQLWKDRPDIASVTIKNTQAYISTLNGNPQG